MRLALYVVDPATDARHARTKAPFKNACVDILALGGGGVFGIKTQGVGVAWASFLLALGRRGARVLISFGFCLERHSGSMGSTSYNLQLFGRNLLV